MRYIITILLFFFLVACAGRSQVQCNPGGGGDIKSQSTRVTIDIRCQKISKEAKKKGEETGVCYKGHENIIPIGIEDLHPDPKKCKALKDEARKQCKDLPPAGPDDFKVVDISDIYEIYKKENPIIKEGKPVCE